jgi:hypothetical protein
LLAVYPAGEGDEKHLPGLKNERHSASEAVMEYPKAAVLRATRRPSISCIEKSMTIAHEQ